MKREIKFRVWCNDKNEWEKDLCLLDHNGDLHHVVRMGVMIPVKKESHILEQYTGLKDKNGKEIYEGDVVLLKSNRKKEIVFNFGSFGYMANDEHISLTPYHECEIIGNIHEERES